ncbi:hypothetical protein [Micromonospora sp. NPDC049799]|uniref:hypothetical protein n=1 Tax=Micromonospora sp. NPDC049799 TaxID=3154741 RepID=UPI0033C4AB6A
MRLKLSTVLVGVLGLAAVSVFAAPAAQAAPATTTSTATVADRLVFEPTERGYRGSLQVELTYHGSEPAWPSYVITEPVPGSYVNAEWGINCSSGGDRLPDGRTTVECVVPGGLWQPGERRTFSVDFQVLTTVRPYAMKAGNGHLAVKVGDTTVEEADFSTRFRSSTGSLANPQPYVRDTQPDFTLSVAGDLTVTRQPDGWFEGSLPVTLRYNSDAPHPFVWLVPAGLPAGFGEPWTDECGHLCPPGGAFMEGEERTFALNFSASSEAALGDLGRATIEVRTDYYTPLADSDPSDNVAGFTVTAVDAA